ncbi:hypothetical protein HELRODRAFT_171997 [Helobdella robusta]|uniref:Peptidase S1 domain-containing protein n=1 Tax=Helobdella robusta TaxID=6412 RepID=T1F4X5_HELRO|nr:hypothetical protein HELRODRAFT_171997 [Helobdella robusta]ESO04989.1 hypothetical protein HELRODRAFT_171997 [Helobdella robusta]
MSEAFDVCVATGHGNTDMVSNSASESKYLLQGRMNPMTNIECKYAAYVLTGSNEFDEIFRGDDLLCVGSIPTYKGTNVCSGDSGGPYVCRNSRLQWTQIGIANFVIGRAQANLTCALSVFAKVSYRYDAIMKAIK